MNRTRLVSLATVLLASLISMSCGATTPAVPTGLTCQWLSSSEIGLSWDASSGADGYNIYRCTGAGCTPTSLIHSQLATSWSDTGLASNTIYCYRLTAYNEADESDYSSIVSCTTYDPEAAWNKTYGGSGYDWACSVQQTSDGGYIIAGETVSYGAGDSDVWLIKTDSSGNVVWDKTFGGPGLDSGNSAQQTLDGGYIVTGKTYSYGAGNGDVWLIKTDSSGNLTWNKTFGGSDYDSGFSVQETSGGGYIVAGGTRSYGTGGWDAWLIKTDSSGNLAWNKTFGGSGWDDAYSVQQTSDGGYIIAGTTDSYGVDRRDLWLIKTDPSGTLAWSKTFGGPADEYGFSVQQTLDGGYITAGKTYSYGAGGWDVWLIKTDSSGNLAWNRTFGGSDWDGGYSVQQTSDEGYIITGETHSFGVDDWDVWLVKTDSSGNLAWSKAFGGSDWDDACSVQQTSDGGYIVAGRTDSYGAGNLDIWLIKINA